MATEDSGDDRKMTYEDGDGRVVYRASAVGGCSKMLILSRLGVDEAAPSEKTKKAWDQGNVGEPRVLAMLEEKGWSFTDHQREVEVNVGKGIVIRGHIDTIGTSPEGVEFLVEVKCLEESGAKRAASGDVSAYPTYPAQLRIYTRAVELPGVWAIGVKDEDGEVVDVLLHFPTDDELPSIAKIMAKVASVELAAARNDVPDACDVNNWFCPFWFLHEEKEVVEVDEEVAAEIDELLAEYNDAAAREKDGKAKKAELKPRIEKFLDANELTGKKYKTPLWVATDVITIGKRALQTDAVKAWVEARGGDFERFYKLGKGSRYPLVNARKEGQ